MIYCMHQVQEVRRVYAACLPENDKSMPHLHAQLVVTRKLQITWSHPPKMIHDPKS